MKGSTFEVTRRTVVAAIAGLSSAVSIQPDDGGKSDQKRAGRLLFDNDTDRKARLTVAIVKNGMERLSVTPKRGHRTTVRYPEPLSRNPSVFQKPIVDMKPLPKSTVVSREYTVRPGAALKVLIEEVSRQDTLFYAFQPWSKHGRQPIENYGKIRCTSHFDVYLSDKRTQSTCGGRLGRIDRQQAKKTVIHGTQSK